MIPIFIPIDPENLPELPDLETIEKITLQWLLICVVIIPITYLILYQIHGDAWGIKIYIMLDWIYG